MPPINLSVQDSFRPASPVGPEIDIEGLIDNLLVDTLTPVEMAKIARTSIQTISRWQSSGCTGADGRIHVLPVIRVGHRRYTRRSDFTAFIKSINARG